MNLSDQNISHSAFNEFCKKLQHQLLEELPGEMAQLKMSSRVRFEELRMNYDISAAIPSSVLILLYLDETKIKVPFILRPQYDGVHSGQISFPGGRKEKDDGTSIETALREAKEEVNINPEKITVLGKLTELFIPPSNYIVTPILAVSKFRPNFVPQASEVDKIIEADISFLLNDSLKKLKNLHVRNTEIEAPYYDVNNQTIWGATAMMLSELEEVIKSID